MPASEQRKAPKRKSAAAGAKKKPARKGASKRASSAHGEGFLGDAGKFLIKQAKSPAAKKLAKSLVKQAVDKL